MRRTIGLIGLLVALVAAGASPAAAGNDSDRNHVDFWEAKWPGFECRKFDGGDATSVSFTGFGFDRYRLVLKGGSKFNDGDGFRVVIYNARPGVAYDNPTGGTRTISHYIVCGRDVEREQLKPRAYVDAYGPKGDPWYRFVLRNPGQTPATCRVVFRGHGERTVVRRHLRPGTGYRTGWRFVDGSTTVRMACKYDGRTIWRRSFQSAAPGFYGPITYRPAIGYFRI